MAPEIKGQKEVIDLKSKLSAAVEDLPKTYTILREGTGADSVEILFYNSKKELFYDKVKGTEMPVKFLTDKSILGHAFLTKKAHLSNVNTDTLYNVAIDNPFKTNIHTQAVIPVISNNNIEGILRFAKFDVGFDEDFIERIKQLKSSFRDIFLNELYAKYLLEILQNAIRNDEFISQLRIKDIEEDFLLYLSGGDARIMLSIFESAVLQEIDKKEIKDMEVIELTTRG